MVSCTSGVYQHYPKAKKQHTQKLNKKRRIVFEKRHYSLTSLSIKKYPIAIPPSGIYRKELEDNTLEKNCCEATVAKKTTIPPSDGRPKDLTQTNKKAKISFASSIIALGSLAAGIALAPILLLVMIPFAVLAFIYSIIALKQIKRTGEYGKTKAEFALYSSIFILVLSIAGILAYLSSNGTGFQIGSFVFY